MTLRRKGLRRVAMLMVILVILGSTGLAVAYKHRRTVQQQIDTDRKMGIQAALVEDYQKAIDLLDKVINQRPEDNDAAYYFALSRSFIEEPRGQHIREAVTVLEDVVKRDPSYLQAKHLLLDLYQQAANTEQKIDELARKLLADDPKDTIAIRSLITLDRRKRDNDKALAHAMEYASLRPDDLKSHMLVMQLMSEMKKSASDIQYYADQQYKGDANDARFLVLQAYTANYQNDNQKARQLLNTAAGKTLTDPAVVKTLSSLFDQLKNYKESQDVLQKAVAETNDPELIKILAIRLWQFGKNDQIVDLLAKINPSSRKTDVDLIAILTMARYELKQSDQTFKLIEILKSRKETPKSAGWVLALQARYDSENMTPLTMSQAFRKALTKYPDNGIINAWLGDTYWSLGEATMAIHYWGNAARDMPSWSKPYVGMSQALLALERVNDSMDAAREAYDRMPSATSTINLAMVRFRLIEETADQQGAIELLKLVDNIQQTIPNESSTLPIKVSLLVRTGQRQAAIDQVNSILKNNAPLDSELALRLAAVSRAEGLDLEQTILSAIAEDKITPKVALTRAVMFADSGKPQDGLEYLNSLIAKQKSPSQDWEMARAKYLDVINHPTAADTWRKLGNQYPESIEVQHTILTSAKDLRSDRSYIETTINRLKALTGPDAERWKIERARWLIESPDVTKDSVEAATILTDVVHGSPYQIEPRLELARAFERMGNKTSAIEHLREAQKIDPKSASITLELVRLLQEQGSTDQVSVVLRQLSSSAVTTAYQRVVLAAMYADVGENQRAFDLLIPDENRHTLSPAGRLLLADLYRNNQQNDQAMAIYDSLLQSQNPSIGAIAQAAQFYASQSNLIKARQIMDRLAAFGDKNIDTTIAQARFEDRFGDKETSLRLFRKAADSGAEQGCLALIDYLMEQKDYPQVIAVGRDAHNKLPDSNAISSRLMEAEARSLLKTNPNNVQPLIDALSKDPSRAAEAEVLSAIDQIRTNNLKGADAIKKLRAVADKYPRLLALQEQLIHLYLQNQKKEDAILIAQRTMESMPTEPQAAALAVHTFRSAGRWGEMRLAAEQWKRRDTNVLVDADISIAEALIELNKYPEAKKQIEPYSQTITQNVKLQPQGATVLARMMIHDNQNAAAQTLLEPLLADTAGRKIWINLAANPLVNKSDADGWMKRAWDAIPTSNYEERLNVLNRWTALSRRNMNIDRLKFISSELDTYHKDQPKDVSALLLSQGIHFQLGETEQAETELRKIIELNPEMPSACNDLAYLLMTKPGADQAETEKLAAKAVQLAPTSAAYLDTLARIHLKANHLDQAKTCFERALNLDPELVDARIGLARLLKEIGDTTAAIRELKRADQQLSTDPEAAGRLKQEADSLRQALSRTDSQ